MGSGSTAHQLSDQLVKMGKTPSPGLGVDIWSLRANQNTGPMTPRHRNQLSKENMTMSDSSRPLAMDTRLRNSFLSATLKI